ncbi:MAG: NAD(P)H-dependent oxidoreductase [Candidatus Hydrogenedentes bacterium]|nr:NAD(P)H-dependent oxidoreductase [Candidatus Hydrogenedentota bacterium]
MAFLVVSSSLNPNSRSRCLARAAFARLEASGIEAEYVDLQEYSLPLCDGSAAYAHPAVGTLAQRIREAEGIVYGVPVYNFGAGATAKNLIELTGSSWSEKVVGFLCAAGGNRSYMAVMGLANSLMLDFRAIIVPRFVYANDSAFRGDEVADEKILRRIEELVTTVVRFARALNPLPERPR